jgi:2',3'-cyclic-nucleotide 2'-phosphodiesterase (5'-nucleotidase family)
MFKRFTIMMIVLTILSAGLISTTAAQDDDTLVTVSIIHTSDEHGWLEPTVPFGSDMTLGGAANIYSWWVENEGYTPETHLLLSGGDNWTGPAISTWFNGASTMEVMNLMGYDASAIGNHEFDFGRDVMAERFSEANYPYLAANIRYADTGELADFAIPYAIQEVSGVQVGIIGLTTRDTVTTTHPRNISDLEFTDYIEALQEFVPQMREAGAQIIIVTSHACFHELTPIAQEVPELVDAMFTGHCNQYQSQTINGVSIMGGGASLQSYARLNITFDTSTNEITALDQSLARVEYVTADGNPVTPNPEIDAVVADWSAEVNAQLSIEIGYLENTIDRQSWTQGNWVTDAWLWAYPSADAAVTNWGGLRQDTEPGTLTWGNLVGLMPFDNYLVTVEITGAQLIANLDCCSGAIGGMTFDGDTITFLDGREFDPDATYTVLISDFMYAGGDDYLFGEQDPEGYDTGIHWRQPVIDYTASLNTSADDPLDNYLDTAPRN